MSDITLFFGGFFSVFFNLHKFLYVLNSPTSLNSPDQDSLRPPPLPSLGHLEGMSSSWDLHCCFELEEQSRGMTAAVWPLSVTARQQGWAWAGRSEQQQQLL